MPDHLGAGRAAGLAGHDRAQLRCFKTFRQLLDLRRFSASLTTLEGDEAPASGSPFGHRIAHGQSFSALARNMPITSSWAPSIARRMVEPASTESAAYTGLS